MPVCTHHDYKGSTSVNKLLSVNIIYKASGFWGGPRPVWDEEKDWFNDFIDENDPPQMFVKACLPLR